MTNETNDACQIATLRRLRDENQELRELIAEISLEVPDISAAVSTVLLRIERRLYEISIKY